MIPRWNLLAAVAACAAFSSVAAGQEKKSNVVVAVVDSQKILQSATVIKGLVKQRDVVVKRFRAEAVREQNRLRRAYAQLDRQCAARSIQWCRRERIKLSDQVNQIRRLNQIRRQQVARSWQASIGKVLGEVSTVVKAISIERGLTLVMLRRNLIHYSPEYDITDEVLKRLNKAMPKLKFEFPLKGDKIGGGKGQPAKKPAKKK